MDQNILIDYIKHLVENKKMPLRDVSLHLQQTYPGVAGLSKSSVGRLCQDNHIDVSKPLSDADLDMHVADAVNQVGPTWGRGMVKGYLESHGIFAGRNRIGTSLKRVTPLYHQLRLTGTEKNTNPQSYHADYFGYNIHFDQNEKLGRYGVTLVMAVDGKSSYVVGSSVMPVKNNKIIYEEVFSQAVQTYGLWETMVVDQGKEFFLSEYAQHYLRETAERSFVTCGVGRHCGRMPYKQVKSTKNTRVERLWEEVNNKVDYSYKASLVKMVDDGKFDEQDPHDLFSMSQVLIPLVKYSFQEVWAPAHNRHYIVVIGRTIPSRGTPQSYLADIQTLPVMNLLSLDDIVDSYEEANGGRPLSEPKISGEDKLDEYPNLQVERDNWYSQELLSKIGSVPQICATVHNRQSVPLEAAIQLHIDVTDYYFQQI